MRRRTLVALGFLALAILLGRVVAAFGGHDDSAAAPVVAATAPTSPSPSPSLSLGEQPDQAAAAAETWTSVWLNTTGGQRAWLARLQPITDGELYDGLALPGVVAAVPHGAVQPGAQVLDAQDGVTSVRVPTTAGPMLVDLTLRGGSWVVVSNDRAGQ